MTDKDKKDKRAEELKRLTEEALTLGYWTSRAENIILKNEATVMNYEDKLKTAFELTKQRLQDEIEAFYSRYAENNKISLGEARARLNKGELKSFRARQKTYLKAVDKIKEGKLSSAYINKAKRLGAKAYVSKIDELTAKLDFELEQLAIEQSKGMGSIFKKGYNDAYKGASKMVEGGMIAEVTFSDLGNKQLLAAVQAKWLGSNFSDRIWNNKAKLINNLERLLPTEFVRGRGPQAVARDLAKRMDVSYNDAVRLVRTEMNYISNQGVLQGLQEAKVKEFQFAAILDERTSEICHEMNGNTYPMDQAEPGVNVPPLHPNCRSTIIPYFPEVDQTGEDDISEQVF